MSHSLRFGIDQDDRSLLVDLLPTVVIQGHKPHPFLQWSGIKEPIRDDVTHPCDDHEACICVFLNTMSQVIHNSYTFIFYFCMVVSSILLWLVFRIVFLLEEGVH